jgi:DNA polymerase-1
MTDHSIYRFGTLAEVQELVDLNKELCVDLETTAKYSGIRLVQFYQANWPQVILVEWPNAIELAGLLTYVRFSAHNAHYEITTIQTDASVSWVPKEVDDTFLMARLAFPALPGYSYDEVVFTCIGYDPYKQAGLDKKELQKSDWSRKVLTKEQLLYAAYDVYYMPDIISKVNATSIRDEISYKLDIHTLLHCCAMQWSGLPVSEERRTARVIEAEKRLKEINLPINCNSYQQVRKYLGSDESNDEALAQMISEGNERAKNVRETRKLKKRLMFLAKYAVDRVIGKFKPSARSGRLTSEDDNMQQIPRSLKDIFEAGEGKVLLYADYAQLELRTACAITNCKRMADLFRRGEDLHTYTSLFLFGEQSDPEKKAWFRQVAKGCNFLLLYGGGIPMFVSVLLRQMDLVLDLVTATRARVKWRNLWPEIYAWQNRGIANWKAGRLGRTPLGRKYKADMMTDQLNIENQGAGAEVAKLAFHYYMSRHNEQNKKFAIVCNFIHDSFIIECDATPALYFRVAKQLAQCMQEAWFEVSKCFAIKDLPMPVEVKIGKNWGDLEKGKDVIETYTIDGMHYYVNNEVSV